MEHPENDDQYKGLKVNKGIADVPTVNPYIKNACPTQGNIRLPNSWKVS